MAALIKHVEQQIYTLNYKCTKLHQLYTAISSISNAYPQNTQLKRAAAAVEGCRKKWRRVRDLVERQGQLDAGEEERMRSLKELLDSYERLQWECEQRLQQEGIEKASEELKSRVECWAVWGLYLGDLQQRASRERDWAGVSLVQPGAEARAARAAGINHIVLWGAEWGGPATGALLDHKSARYYPPLYFTLAPSPTRALNLLWGWRGPGYKLPDVWSPGWYPEPGDDRPPPSLKDVRVLGACIGDALSYVLSGPVSPISLGSPSQLSVRPVCEYNDLVAYWSCHSPETAATWYIKPQLVASEYEGLPSSFLRMEELGLLTGAQPQVGEPDVGANTCQLVPWHTCAH